MSGPEILLVNPSNPRRRRRRRKTTARRRRRRNPVAANPRRRRRRRAVAKRRVRRRRNPQRLTAAKIQRNVTVATQGALGALGLDIALAYIPLPAQLTGPFVGPVIKGLGAIGLGVVANMMGVRADTANRMAEGALTVQIHGIGRQMLGQFMPGVALAAYVDGMGYYGSGWNPNAIDDPDWESGMGTYLPDISADDISMDEGGFGAYVNEEAGFAW